MEDYITEVLEELISLKAFERARRVLSLVDGTYSRHDEYLQKILDKE